MNLDPDRGEKSDEGSMYIALSLENVDLINLDTFDGNPMELTDPVVNEPHWLHTEFALGMQARPVSISMDATIASYHAWQESLLCCM